MENSWSTVETPLAPPTAAAADGACPAVAPLHGESLTIVVPTRNEAPNVEPLLERIAAAVQGLPLEVVFVDDSTDDTPDTVRRMAGRFPFPVRLIARPPERRNGLGKAVVEGMAAATGSWICVMDGDLQHPPEVIPQLLDRALQRKHGLVAASRLADGGSTDGLTPFRRFVSVVLAWASHILFPRTLRSVSDPLTGFFVVRRAAIDPARLRPDGFKILLEVLVRTPRLSVGEVPFEFDRRNAGASKASTVEVWRLVRQMVRLTLVARARLLRFATVGGTGLVVNTVALALLVSGHRLHYLLAAVLATQVSTTWNYLLTDRWVFGDRRTRGASAWRRAAGFFAMNNAALLVRGPLLAVMVGTLGIHVLVANVASILLVLVARYVLSDRILWSADLAPLPTSLEA